MGSERDVLLAAIFAVSLISTSEGIMGGTEATPHSRPYMASIQVLEGEVLRHDCGGFVVADQWVMTAAHCLSAGSEGKKVVLGLHSLSEPEETKQTFDILEFYVSPDFNPVNFDNDIALIKLDQPFNTSEAVKAVAFLRAGGANPDTDAEVDTAGWGTLDDLGYRPDKLREVVVNIVSPQRCKRSDYFGTKFTENMMCAHKICPQPCNKPYRKQDSCDGDSGGPLLYNGIVVGITSSGGKKCAKMRNPGIYTIISHHTAWIDSILNSLPPTPAADSSS